MIHRYWYGDEPDDAMRTLTELRSMNGQGEVMEWRDRHIPPRIVGWLDSHMDDVPERDRYRHRANLFRLWVLEDQGGWWLDHDFVLLVPIVTLAYPAVAEHVGVVCNCALGLPAHHPWLQAALDEVERGHHGGSVDVSGEGLLERLRWQHAPDVRMLRLPFDALGRYQPGPVWGYHRFASASRRDDG